jgi:hypothetical protein
MICNKLDIARGVPFAHLLTLNNTMEIHPRMIKNGKCANVHHRMRDLNLLENVDANS